MNEPIRTCEGCTLSRMVFRSEWRKERLRCMRDRTLRLGPVAKHLDVGSDIDRETDTVPEPHRVDGDKCGPTRRHFVAKGAV
jgi:hypothetical protein